MFGDMTHEEMVSRSTELLHESEVHFATHEQARGLSSVINAGIYAVMAIAKKRFGIRNQLVDLPELREMSYRIAANYEDDRIVSDFAIICSFLQMDKLEEEFTLLQINTEAPIIRSFTIRMLEIYADDEPQSRGIAE